MDEFFRAFLIDINIRMKGMCMSQIEVESISSVKRKLSITIESDRINKKIEESFQKMQKKAQVKGFRPGKTPRQILEKMYSREVEEDVIDKLMETTYQEAVNTKNLFPVSTPKIDSQPYMRGQNFTYSAEVEIKPEIQLHAYKGIEIKKEQFIETDIDVQELLKNLQERNSSFEPVSGRSTLMKGDTGVIDFFGSIDGKPFDGGSSQNYYLEIGSGKFIPGFEEQLIGMEKDSEKDITVKFPDDYGAENLKGKQAVFHIRLKQIRVKTLPELNDEFAKQTRMAETLEDLKTHIMTEAVKQKKYYIDSRAQHEILAHIISTNPFELPESMIDTQTEFMKQETLYRLQMQGIPQNRAEQMLIGFESRTKKRAEAEVRKSLILETIAKTESITSSSDDFKEKIQEIAEVSHQSLQKVESFYSEHSRKIELDNRIKEEKTLRFLEEQAKISFVPRDQLGEDSWLKLFEEEHYPQHDHDHDIEDELGHHQHDHQHESHG